jgi:hypothetical protein
MKRSHQQLDGRRHEKAEEHHDGRCAPLLAGPEHVGTSGSFGKGEHAVLLDDERPPQRNHH